MNFYKLVSTKIIPSWYIRNRLKKKFTLWIVGCGYGAVAYNFAIILNEFKERHQDFDYEILVTDFDEKRIKFAKRAIFPEESIEGISLKYKKKYFLKSKDRSKRLIRVAPEIRCKVKFRKIESFQGLGFRENMDIIKINSFENFKVSSILKIVKYLDCKGYLISHKKIFLPNLKQVSPLFYRRIN